jgi:hypothetical protein
MARKIEILKSFLYYESEKNFLKQSIYWTSVNKSFISPTLDNFTFFASKIPQLCSISVKHNLTEGVIN